MLSPARSFQKALLHVAIGAVSMSALSACGLGGGGGEAIPRRNAQTVTAQDALPGTWASECMKNAVTGHFEIWKFDVTKASDDWSMTLRQEAHAQFGCSDDALSLHIELSQGAFSRAEPLVLSLDPFSAISIAQTEAEASARNTEKLCGREDWSAGVPVELTPTSCASAALASRTVVTKVVNEDEIQITTCQRNECQSLKLIRTSL